MAGRADIGVYSPDDKLRLVVEVKNSAHANAEWAAKLRRNLLAHNSVPHAQFFMLALPDRLYLWKDAGSTGDEAPHFTAGARELLKDYLRPHVDPESLRSEQSLELAITAWLQEVVRSFDVSKVPGDVSSMLIKSGLYEAIKRGTVATQVAA